MNINIALTQERIISGIDGGYITISKFNDENLERIHQFSNLFVYDYINNTTVRIYFELFNNYNITLYVHLLTDNFSLDLCDGTGNYINSIYDISNFNNIIDNIEELYIKNLQGKL